MLFLVLGFLEFPDQRDSDKTFTAPWSASPSRCKRRKWQASSSSPFSTRATTSQRTSRFERNCANDFGLVLPELPEEQIDVNGYFSEIQSIIKKQPGFALKHRVSSVLAQLQQHAAGSRPGPEQNGQQTATRTL